MISAAGQQWNGKKWYCYGTSMTDDSDYGQRRIGTTPDGQPNQPGRTGYFTDYLAQYAGMQVFNFGKGNSGIIPALHGEDNVKSRVMTLEDGKAEADLITLEVLPNDARGQLGECTDWSDDTFCGNLNQILAYLLSNTQAVVVVLIATRARYQNTDPGVTYPPGSAPACRRQQWETAVEAICAMHGVPCWNAAAQANLGYFRMGMDQRYVSDQIHLTEKGSQILAKYCWGKLQSMYPIKE